ncbi:MAG: lysophospholipid acyltransferase family protein [Gaiellaceae bacterium]
MSAKHRPSLLYLLLGGLSYPVLRIVYRERWRGLERLPPEGGYVLAANHWSSFDPWPLGIPLYPRRFLRFMAKSELFWFPLGPAIKAGGGFKVRRGQRDQEAIDTAVRLCREGHVVVMFPEGTRRQKGLRKKREARWRSGAARIALEAGVPLVPAGIAGTDGLLRLERIRVAFGAPVPIDDLAGLPLDEAANEATNRLRDAITELEASL